MSLNGNTWGEQIANAIIASATDSLTAEEEQTLIDGWQLIANQHVNYIVNNAEVDTTTTSDGSTGTGTAGGPLPIVSLAGSGEGTIS